MTLSPLISAHELTDWLNRMELHARHIPIEHVKARVRFMQAHGDAYHSQFNPAV